MVDEMDQYQYEVNNEKLRFYDIELSKSASTEIQSVSL